MAEHALSYVITLVLVGNVSMIGALAAIILLLPRMPRRRPAHRAETAPLRTRLTLVPPRPTTANGATARAA
jgi:hypothetical protein